MWAFKLSECYTYYRLIPINLLSLPSDSFFIAIWPLIMKEKAFTFELRTRLVNDPSFVYFNVSFMTFVVLNTHWRNLLLSTFFSLFLSPEESSSPKSSFTWIPETLSPDESNEKKKRKMFPNQVSAEGYWTGKMETPDLAYSV